MTEHAPALDIELETLRSEASRYRWLREQTWYIEAAGRELGLIKPRRSALVDAPPLPDWDEVEEALDRVLSGSNDYVSPYQ
jgi:hypothetical protein